MLRFLRKKQTLLVWALVALTETAVAIPWMIFFYAIIGFKTWPEALPGVWLLLVIFALASAWEAGERSGEEGGSLRRALAAPVGVVGALLVAYYLQPQGMRTGLLSGHAAWGMLPVAAYLWFQGTMAVAEGLDYSRIFSAYTVKVSSAIGGVVMLIVSHNAADPRAQVLLYWSVLLLFAAGLMSLIVARDLALQSGQARTGDQGERRFRTSPIVGSIIGGLLVLTLASSYVLSTERLVNIGRSVFGVVSAVFTWFADVILLLVYRWVLLLGPVLEKMILWFMAQQKKVAQEAPQVQPGDPDKLPEPEKLKDLTFLAPYLKILVLVAVVVLLVIVLYRFSRRRRRGAASEEEEVVSLGFWQNLMADLKSLLARKQPEAVVAESGPAPEVLDPRDPRVLFRRLQAWGAALGRPRVESETPAAYGQVLESRRPARAQAVGTITALYNQARYGAKPPAAAQVDQAVRAAEQLQQPEPDSDQP